MRAAQIIHAAGESAGLSGLLQLPIGTRAVALEASASELVVLEERLQSEGIPHAAIREPDPPWDGELVALGIAPLYRTKKLRRLMSSLGLVR